MQIPMADIATQNGSLEPELRAAIAGVVARSEFIGGPAVEKFEQQFAEFVGVEHCIGVNSGTSALHLALIACGVGPGDEVITTPHTWISTSWAIRYVGARPVFVDIDPLTWNLDARLVEAAITARTRAILPVHLYGQAADLPQLSTIAERHGLVLIEDAAQAHGAIVGSKRVGGFGRVGCFSFYPGKNLGACGEAGAVVTNDRQIADRIRRLRDHAQQGRHNHVELGFNARMDGLQAAVLSVKLPHLDNWTSARRAHAEHYLRQLAGVSGLQLPVATTAESHVWHLFVCLLPAAARSQVQEQLAERGVATAIHYPVPVPLQPAFADLGYRPGDLPVADHVTACCLSLPLYPELTPQQIDYIATQLGDILPASTSAAA